MAKKTPGITVNFDLRKDLFSFQNRFERALKETMEEVYQLSQSKVKVRTSDLKKSGKRGVKKKPDGWVGWCSYGRPGIRYAQVLESRNSYLKVSFDRIQKGFEEKI